MKNLIVLLILAIATYWAYGQYERQQEAKRVAEAAGLVKKKAPAGPKKADETSVTFLTCDGRNTCAQMTSCEEAKFYVKSCPGMSSEGTRGGVSCEKQWCR